MTRKFIIGLIAVLVFLLLGGFFYLQSLAPRYEGKTQLQGISQPVDVYYDTFGIPHIYAKNKQDLYRTFGYVHAQDRLFQMEMLRRVGGGRLSEILGTDFVKIDKFFRTLGIDEASKKAVSSQYLPTNHEFRNLADAYLAGVNAFMEKGPTPLEFLLLGIPKEPFTPQDLYNIAGYMSFSFAEAFKTDPLVQELKVKLGPSYLQDLQIDWAEVAEKIPIHLPDSTTSTAYQRIHSSIDQLMEGLPIPPWIGSNGWVVGPSKTASGSVVFCNDTHIGYSQPSVWYEAHLECPEFSFYGNHLGGFPFALVGHTRHHAWGMTMFENDDVDFYLETLSEDGQQVKFKGDWKPLNKRVDSIFVKGGDVVAFEISETPHGPLINGLVDGVDSASAPVSVWWMYPKNPLKLLEAAHGLSYSKSLNDFQETVSLIHAPGLNVMYGDKAGNIAWWACGQLFERPPHVQSKTFLDGASGKDEIEQFLDFSFNPKSINPPTGFVYSSNNQPDTVKGQFYPGYYVPEDRAKRITALLEREDNWTLEKMRTLLTDDVSSIHGAIAQEMLSASGLLSENGAEGSRSKMLQLLKQWNGGYDAASSAPTVFNAWLYHSLKGSFLDEMGDSTFQTFVKTHLMKRSLQNFMENDSSLFWDDVQTEEVENRKAILVQSFEAAHEDLTSKLGEDAENWRWGNVHTLEHQHVLAAQKPFDQIFNVGSFPISGGNETINNQGFYLSENLAFETVFGPAMRISIDFADVEQAESILPTGQSGNLMSEFYSDQAKMFVDGQFRKMLMNEQEIKAQYRYKLSLEP